MRIIITADLHYNIPASRGPTERVAAEICRCGGDALVLAGDTCGHDLKALRDCLRLFDAFDGVKMLVAGNHELWTTGQDSLHKYEHELPQAAESCGFHYLDNSPLELDGVAFVGSAGWYDYSFRVTELEVPLRFYESKVGPGAARVIPKHAALVERRDDVPESAWSISLRWMDGEHVHLPMDDPSFVKYLCDKLRAHLTQVQSTSHTIVAALHHVPFRELVYPPLMPGWEFGVAFMGSHALADVLLEFDKVRYVYCGHSHNPGRVTRDHLTCINVGCTYRSKRFEVLDLQS